MRLRNRISVLLMIATVVCLVVAGGRLGFSLLGPARKLVQGNISFPSFVESVQTISTEKFFAKYHFINLNGWFAGVLKQTKSNDVIRLKNGMLTTENAEVSDHSANAANMAEFSRFLEERGIPFLFIQVPHKIDMDGSLLPDGTVNRYNVNAGLLLDLLEPEDVRALDLRYTLAGTPELVEQNFFRTDHHWTYTGALTALQEIVREFENMFPDAQLDLSRADPSQWELHVLKDWHLGTWGRRVGLYFAGVDDLAYYTPVQTDMTRISCAIPDEGLFYKGDFSDAIIRKQLLAEQGYFNASVSAYYLYMGYDYPLMHLRNPDAPNDLKVLIIKDSFATPVLGYMSVLFQEVDVVDPRYYEGSIAQYALFSQPDIVIEMIASSSRRLFYTYGMENAGMDVQECVFAAESLDAGSVPVKLASGETYMLSFDDVELDAPSASIVLLRAGDHTRVDAAVFDVEYCRENGGFSCLLHVPDGEGEDFELDFSSGTLNTSTGKATFSGVRLERVG